MRFSITKYTDMYCIFDECMNVKISWIAAVRYQEWYPDKTHPFHMSSIRLDKKLQNNGTFPTHNNVGRQEHR